MANRHRLTAQLGIVALFDRRIEGVHVDVDDLAPAHGAGLPDSGTKGEYCNPGALAARLTGGLAGPDAQTRKLSRVHARRAEVGDIEEALAFYGRLFEFALRGMAFQHPDSRGLADLAKYERLHLTTSELR